MIETSQWEEQGLESLASDGVLQHRQTQFSHSGWDGVMADWTALVRIVDFFGEGILQGDPEHAKMPMAMAFMLEVVSAVFYDRKRFFSKPYWRAVVRLRKTGRVQICFALMTLSTAAILADFFGRLIQFAFVAVR